MYNLIEKKTKQVLFLPQQTFIQPSYVTSAETLAKFRQAIAEHKKATSDRIEILKYNIEAYKKDIANIEALKNTLAAEYEKLIGRFNKAFEGTSELLLQYINRPHLSMNNCEPRSVNFLKEDMKVEQEQLKDQELRLKILINNEKEINKLYGND